MKINRYPDWHPVVETSAIIDLPARGDIHRIRIIRSDSSWKKQLNHRDAENTEEKQSVVGASRVT